jgi:hypothetical protein
MVYYASTVVDTLLELTTCSALEMAFLTINHSYFNQYDLFGTDSFLFLSNVYYRDTVLTLSYETVANCDSVEEVHIFITHTPPPCQATNGSLNLDSCNQITYKNKLFFNDTIFVDTLVNADGCDSLLTVNLIINRSYF